MGFSAQVDAWVTKSQDRLLRVRNESAQRVIGQAQRTRAEGGNMRVDTGFLRASGQGSTEEMPKIDSTARPTAGGAYDYNVSTLALIIAGASLSDTIYWGYTASYAAFREHEDGFVRLAAQNWRSIVQQVAEEARKRAGP